MIVDLFAGMGGWTEGLAALGFHDVGIEIDEAACRTRLAAGHQTIRADVATFPLGQLVRRVDGLIASPPCTDWSQSGGRAGLDGDTGALVLEVDRWVRALRPRWVACEQVPPALEWWHHFALAWQALGYSTWAGVLNAANYGVPQTRQRAILLASSDCSVGPPRASHDRYPMPSLFGADVLPWVSMAAALDWIEDSDEMRYQRGAGMTERYGARPARPARLPAPTLTGSALGAGAGPKMKLYTNRGQDEHGNRQQVPSSAPAPALSTKAGGQWWWDLPSTTLGGDPRVSPRCHHDEGMQGRDALAAAAAAAAAGEGTGLEPIRLTIRDALILQSFRPDYPVQGNKTKQFEQIGNAVPPLLARAILAPLLCA